ncbi:MAG: bifunctional demethylmenaquinone methyltransferase/2-methoxy-6-polyprenyl-1,4-benzoquinol methylase UbiE [Bacteroidota bacterium]
MKEIVTPYQDSKTNKKEQVATMFDNIAGSYDFLNHFLSMGIDIIWRKKAIRLLKKYQPKYILDVATGTGDLAIAALKLHPDKIIGVDISEKMIEIGKEKIKKKNLNDFIQLLPGDSEKLIFSDETFDAVTVAFGVRNFENLNKGLEDIFRVLKPSGVVVILEFSMPTKFPVKQFYNFYFKFILPIIGRIVSKDYAAYSYLPNSVMAFPQGKAFTGILQSVGFDATKYIPLTFGIATIYIAEKPGTTNKINVQDTPL